MNDFKIAVRTTRRSAEVDAYVNALGVLVAGEIEVQHVGVIEAGPTEPTRQRFQEKMRPLTPGFSVAHYRTTAGTIGGFVQRNNQLLMLSNNHVLALSAPIDPAAVLNDEIVQPGPFDHGAVPGDVVANLTSWVPLQHGVNRVDLALAQVAVGFGVVPTYNGKRLVGTSIAQLNEFVWKVGRTTGDTYGRVTVASLDDVAVSYHGQTLYFDDQIEIEGNLGARFSAGGDSGSLIINHDNYAVGLLFAGSSSTGKTYANQISTVLQHTGGGLLT